MEKVAYNLILNLFREFSEFGGLLKTPVLYHRPALYLNSGTIPGYVIVFTKNII